MEEHDKLHETWDELDDLMEQKGIDKTVDKIGFLGAALAEYLFQLEPRERAMSLMATMIAMRMTLQEFGEADEGEQEEEDDFDE